MPKLDNLGNNLDDSARVFLVQRALIGAGWICAPKSMSLEQVQAAADEQLEDYCPGVPWTIAARKHEDNRLQSPGMCAECEDRQHWFAFGGISGVMLLALTVDTEGFDSDLVVRGRNSDA